jgi:hypothetical protein
MRRNTLHGFCAIELACGLVIHDVAVHQKGGRWWANLPGRPVLVAVREKHPGLDDRGEP